MAAGWIVKIIVAQMTRMVEVTTFHTLEQSYFKEDTKVKYQFSSQLKYEHFQWFTTNSPTENKIAFPSTEHLSAIQ